MTARRPLVLNNGQIEQLQSADTLAGVWPPTPTVETSSFTAVSGALYVLEAGSIVVTLPASPVSGDYVQIAVAQASYTGSSVAGNGANIMANAASMSIDVAPISFTLTYVDATNGWVLT